MVDFYNINHLLIFVPVAVPATAVAMGAVV
jgi:hypothetical protein